MAAQRDGGRAALGGFLYQVVAVIGLRAMFESREDRDDELAALLNVNGAIRIEHEKFDTDAVVESGSGISLIQFKYSKQVDTPRVAQSEYEEIVRALSRAGSRAKGQGNTVAYYYLVTNRKLGSVDASKFSIKDREVAAQLRIAGEIGLDNWFGDLERFGRSFGCSDKEIKDGIDNLVGHVLRSTNTGIPSVERGVLVEAMVKYKDAKPIRRNDLEARMGEELREASEHLWPGGRPIRRRQWNKISQAIFSENRALLFLVGDGGCGKSTALVDWLHEQLRSDTPLRPCVSMRPPDSNSSSWIAEIVAKWSDLPHSSRDRRAEPPPRVIERLGACL